jgi:hypothetical protein
MATTGRPLLNWKQLSNGDEVKVYTGGSWKKGIVTHVYETSCLIVHGNGSTPVSTRIYDTRSIRLR